MTRQVCLQSMAHQLGAGNIILKTGMNFGLPVGTLVNLCDTSIVERLTLMVLMLVMLLVAQVSNRINAKFICYINGWRT